MEVQNVKLCWNLEYLNGLHSKIYKIKILKKLNIKVRTANVILLTYTNYTNYNIKAPNT